MPPAARILDLHVCPMVTGVVPHVGGPILPLCEPRILIGMRPAARITDKCFCVGPMDMIREGSSTVLIGRKFAARMGDKCIHGGVIVTGQINVLIGTRSKTASVGGGGGASKGADKPCRKGAAKKGKPFIRA